MFPSDPLQAPLWTVIVSLTHARRILEVGCGHGYTAAVVASAAGPDCRVDTIEADPNHAVLAERAFEQRGLSRRVRVLSGRGQNVLPKLKGHYDVVFVESSDRAYSHIKRVQPNLVILCMRIEDHEGFQVLSMLKLDAETRGIPVLTYTTEYEGQETEQEVPETSEMEMFVAAKPALPMN